MSYYTVIVLDRGGYTITEDPDVEGLKNAKQRARDGVGEYADAHKAEVRNDKGECLWDVFAEVS